MKIKTKLSNKTPKATQQVQARKLEAFFLGTMEALRR